MFLVQLFPLPDALTNGDLVDAWAYIDHLAEVAYDYEYEIADNEI